MAFLTIQVPGREARARAGLRGHEAPGNRAIPRVRHDPRVDACGRAGVRTTFARRSGSDKWDIDLSEVVGMTSGQLLRDARLRAGLSQAELASRFRRPRSQIARWERGRVEPGFETLRRVLRACGFDISESLVPVAAMAPYST